MSDLITVQVVVISAMDVGEYDKRIVLLTRERGKISAFAKGARRMNSPFTAAADSFVFGEFTLYEGKSSYNLNHVNIYHHFVELASRQPEVFYGYYFLELADYFGREGTDEREMMNLLYVTVKALLNPSIDNHLIRCVFELRTMAEQGMMPQLGACVLCGSDVGTKSSTFWFSQEEHGLVCDDCLIRTPDAVRISESALYAMQYIVCAPIGKLYTFALSDAVCREVSHLVRIYTARNTDRKFKSLQILEMMD